VNRILLCSAAALAILPLHAANAQTAQEAAALFGARPSVLDISLSPSGNKLLYIEPAGPSTEALFVFDLAGGGDPKPILAHRDPDSELSHCEWASDERIICEVYYIADGGGVLIGATRLFALARTGPARRC
jgi:hypothetical protein